MTRAVGATAFTRSGFLILRRGNVTNFELRDLRRVANAALVADLERQTISGSREGRYRDTPTIGQTALITYKGEIYVQSRPGCRGRFLPAGDMDLLGHCPCSSARQLRGRRADGGGLLGIRIDFSVFVMTAHTTTPSIWYVSETRQ